MELYIESPFLHLCLSFRVLHVNMCIYKIFEIYNVITSINPSLSFLQFLPCINASLSLKSMTFLSLIVASLHNQLVCSFLGRTSSPTLSFPYLPVVLHVVLRPYVLSLFHINKFIGVILLNVGCQFTMHVLYCVEI